MRQFYTQYILVLFPLPCIYFFVYPMPDINPLWDIATITGLMAAICICQLFIFGIRPLPSSAYDGAFFLNIHRLIGYLATGFVVLHILLLAIKEPLTLEYLLPTANTDMLSGLLSLVLMVVLIVTSTRKVRRFLWPRGKGYRHWHYGLSLGVLILLGIHMLGANYHASTYVKKLILIVCLTIPAFIPLLSNPVKQQLDILRSVKPPDIQRTRIQTAYFHMVTVFIALVSLIALHSVIHQTGL